MPSISFDDARSILVIDPIDPFLEDDFYQGNRIVDRFFALKGTLKGIIIRKRNVSELDKLTQFLAEMDLVRSELFRSIALLSNSAASTLEARIKQLLLR